MNRAVTASEVGEVASLNHEGAGVIHGGKTVFVDGALPGETVQYRRRRRHRQYDEGELEQVLTASPERVTPRCGHYQLCGGCALQHLQGEAQLVAKQQQVHENLERIARAQPQQWLAPLSGPAWGYRRRARVGVKYVARKGRVVVGFRERLAPLIAQLSRCEVLAPAVGELLEALAELIGTLSIRERLPQIEVAVADNAVALVLRVLSEPSAADRQALAAFQQRHGVWFFLQSGGPATVTALDPHTPSLHYGLPEQQLRLEFLPTDFIQVNGAVNQALVARALQLLSLSPQARVLDLFCGLGNFSLALARQAAALVGIEGDAGLVERARANARANGIENAEFFSADLNLEPLAQPWAQGPYTHVLLDPPRAGARALLRWLARLAPERVLYVSCHPGTLARDLGILVHEHGFEFKAAGVVDMFPHTAHVESVALLTPPAAK